jgi:hypothetical protein
LVRVNVTKGPLGVIFVQIKGIVYHRVELIYIYGKVIWVVDWFEQWLVSFNFVKGEDIGKADRAGPVIGLVLGIF